MEHYTKLAIKWFENNFMKLNEGKCHFLVARHRYETLWAIEKLGLFEKELKNYFD